MTAPRPGVAAVPRYVDLHMHSTASDGAVPPAGVVEAARRAGLTAIALTDHDTLAGIDAARAAGESCGIRVVAGTELSAVYREREIHLLGLHLQRADEVDRRLDEFRQRRRTRADEIVRRLNELGVPITTQQVLDQAGRGAVGRPHVARAMVAEGWAADLRDAFDRYLGNGRPAFVEKQRFLVRDAIRLVHDAGGLAIVAHPGAQGTREWVEGLVQLDIDGLEVLHPSHSAEDVRRLGALVEHFGLVPSGGSDWHGGADGQRAIGGMHVPIDWLVKQDERVAEQAARVA